MWNLGVCVMLVLFFRSSFRSFLEDSSNPSTADLLVQGKSNLFMVNSPYTIHNSLRNKNLCMTKQFALSTIQFKKRLLNSILNLGMSEMANFNNHFLRNFYVAIAYF